MQINVKFYLDPIISIYLDFSICMLLYYYFQVGKVSKYTYHLCVHARHVESQSTLSFIILRHLTGDGQALAQRPGLPVQGVVAGGRGEECALEPQLHKVSAVPRKRHGNVHSVWDQSPGRQLARSRTGPGAWDRPLRRGEYVTWTLLLGKLVSGVFSFNAGRSFISNRDAVVLSTFYSYCKTWCLVFLSEPDDAPTGVETTVMNSTVRVKWNEAQSIRGRLLGYKVPVTASHRLKTQIIIQYSEFETFDDVTLDFNKLWFLVISPERR